MVHVRPRFPSKSTFGDRAVHTELEIHPSVSLRAFDLEDEVSRVAGISGHGS